jgi:WD40 repeat protein
MLMDCVEGESLKAEIFDLDGEPMGAGRVIEIVRPVCSALNYAHGQGMVHCDVKPSNIMIKQSGEVLLADFGVARMTDATTATMVGMGTPAYMAPELVRGLDPTPQTDIYALGIVLFEMLTGSERPFIGDKATITGSTSEKVRWEQMQLQPPSPRRWNPDISPALEAVVLKCLAKEPEKRYSSTLELLNELQTAFGAQEAVKVAVPDEKPTSRPEPKKGAPQVILPERSKTMAEKSKRLPGWAIAGGIVVLVLLVAGIGGILTNRPRDMKATETAVALAAIKTDEGTSNVTASDTNTPLPTPTLTATSSETPTVTPTSTPMAITINNVQELTEVSRFGQGTLEEIVISPDGELLAIASSRGTWIYDAQSMEPINLIGEGAGNVSAVDWSPDGQKIVIGDSLGDVKVWSVDTVELLLLMKGHQEPVTSVAWSQEGSRLASGDEGGTIFIWDTVTGDVLLERRAHTDWVYDVEWSPIGATLASSSGDGTIWAWDDDQQASKYLPRLEYPVYSVTWSPDGSKLAYAKRDWSKSLGWASSIHVRATSEWHLLSNIETDQPSRFSVSWSPDGEHFALCGEGRIEVRDGSTNESLQRLEVPYDSYWGRRTVAWSPDSEKVYCGWQGGVTILDVGTGEQVQSPKAYWGEVLYMTWSLDGTMFALQGVNSHVVWDASYKEQILEIEADGWWVDGLDFHPYEPLVASQMGWDGGVEVWDMKNATRLWFIDEARTGVVSDLEWSPDGKYLGMGNAAANIVLWDMVDDTLTFLHTNKFSEFVESMTWSPEGDQVAITTSWAGSEIWDIKTDRRIRSFYGSIPSGAYSPDGKFFITQDTDRIRIWDRATWSAEDILNATFLAWSNDGSILIVGVDEGIRLYKTSTREALVTLENQRGPIAWSPDGTQLASIDQDGSIVFLGIHQE